MKSQRNNRDHWQGKLALITGASSGIGAVTARKLSGQGMQVLLVARRRDRLEALADELRQSGGQTQVFEADLSNEIERKALFEQVSNKWGDLDVLVNNAGFGWYGYFTDMPWDTAAELIQVNIIAVAHLTRLFLPSMREQNSGHIINVGSISGSIPSQGITMYAASKSFLDAFTTSLYRELQGSHVHVSVVRAGPVVSEFFQQAKHRPGGSNIPAERFAIPAERVADHIWHLLQRPRRVTYIPQVLCITPWIELFFGWLEDRLGPLLLRRQIPHLDKRIHHQPPTF